MTYRTQGGWTRRTFLGAAGGLAATAAAAQPRPEVLDVEAANREGRVSIYTTWVSDGIEPLLAKFRERYPRIQTEFIRLGSNPLIERFQTEFNANRNLCDFFTTFPDERFTAGLERGWALEWTPPEAANFAPSMNLGNKAYTLQVTREAIIWNKQRVRPADAPKEWADLFDPRWKGQVGINPPWRSVAIQQIVAFWEDRVVPDPAERLKANDVRFFEGSAGIIQAVLRGDVRIAEISDQPLNLLLADGAPIGFVYPASGTTLSANRAIVPARAPRPNAGKVFMNWLMTAEGQAHLQTFCGLPVTRNGAPPLSHLPATDTLTNTVFGEELVTPERQQRIVDRWRSVFGIR